jgi:hypothetical protein
MFIDQSHGVASACYYDHFSHLLLVQKSLTIIGGGLRKIVSSVYVINLKLSQ